MLLFWWVNIFYYLTQPHNLIKLDEEKKKEEKIDYYKNQYEKFQKKNEFVNNFNDKYVYGKVRDKLIRDGFVYRCPFCLDVSSEYGRPIETYAKHK